MNQSTFKFTQFSQELRQPLTLKEQGPICTTYRVKVHNSGKKIELRKKVCYLKSRK